MARVVVVNNVTLDGVMQAPARKDEDPRGGFAHGGWGLPYGDSVMAERMGRDMGRSGALLLGRRTYQDFFAVWPGRTDNSYTAVLDNAQKYVVSTTLREPLPWEGRRVELEMTESVVTTTGVVIANYTPTER